jgi:hypothetical protein
MGIRYDPNVHGRIREDSFLELYADGTFRLGEFHPTIIFSDSKIVIGCKSASATAFDKLCKMWLEYREGGKRKIIQSGGAC